MRAHDEPLSHSGPPTGSPRGPRGIDTPRATLEVRRMGEGQLADQFQPMADAMRADGYTGVISFESVYHPGNGNFEDGFRQSIGLFKSLFE